MSGPLQQAGAISEPSRYAPIPTTRFITGLWTQRSPLRDAATPFLYEKFYSGSRFESLIAGLNAELTSRLTIRRRRGHSVYNANNFPKINRFYEFRQFSANTENIRLIADTAASVYDATAGSNALLFGKSAGAGPSFFQGVGNTLIFGNGVDTKKWVASARSWAAAAAQAIGNFIVDTNFNLQVVTAVAGDTKTGGVQPGWSAVFQNTTVDNNVTWTCKGPAIQNFGGVAPVNAPVLAQPYVGEPTFWQPNRNQVTGEILLDSNGNIQAPTAAFTTGLTMPVWNTNLGGITNDGSAAAIGKWINCGPWAPWAAGKAIPKNGSRDDNGYCIIDTNGNIQQATQATTPGTTGAAAPTWNTVVGGTTADNGLSWVNRGNGQKAVLVGWKWGYCYSSSITKARSTMSPATQSTGPIMGVIGSTNTAFPVGITGDRSTDPQYDTVDIMRTSDGGSTFLLEAQIAMPAGGAWSYNSNVPDSGLNILIQAPISNFNDPPPAGFLPMTYHLGCIFGAVNNTVYYSNGGKALFGSSPLDAFSPNNFFIFPSQVIRLEPISVGLLVFTVSDIYIIQGQNTSSSALFSTPFLKGIGLLHYDALTINGGTFYLMTADAQVIQLDPGAGVVEVGFPIGDQFETLYNPATAFLTWHTRGSSEKALYVADGATGWFRMNPTPAPENSAPVWSPQAQLAAGCVIAQSVEVTPGTRELLIQTGNNQPILKRDAAASADNGAAFGMNVTIGSIVLANPGQLAELVFVEADSVRVGTRPTISVLLGEISATQNAPFETLTQSVVDPVDFPESNTLFSDRFYLAQNQQPVYCRHLQVKFTWTAEAAASELLAYSLYGALHQETRQ